jgi:hypothetical protein
MSRRDHAGLDRILWSIPSYGWWSLSATPHRCIRLSPGAATLDLVRLLTDSLRPAVLEAVEQARETLRAVAVGGVSYYELGGSPERGPERDAGAWWPLAYSSYTPTGRASQASATGPLREYRRRAGGGVGGYQ